jgi:hypothetical protein
VNLYIFITAHSFTDQIRNPFPERENAVQFCVKAMTFCFYFERLGKILTKSGQFCNVKIFDLSSHSQGALSTRPNANKNRRHVPKFKPSFFTFKWQQ